jgi:DNA-binding NarL/FixJ family response regulator
LADAAPLPVPPSIAWLVKLVGEEAALALVEAHGGTRLFVPKRVGAHSALARRTGVPAKSLAPLAAAYGGETIKLPLCREWRIRIYRLRHGESYAAIARRLGIVESTVWRVLNDGGMTGQMELPFQSPVASLQSSDA